MDWYPKYPLRFKRGTLGMSLAERGAYNDLLDFYYATEEPLPDNDGELASILGVTTDEWLAVAVKVRAKFTVENRGLVHARAETELETQKNRTGNRIKANRENGKKGGRPKGSKNKVIKPIGFLPETQQKVQTDRQTVEEERKILPPLAIPSGIALVPPEGAKPEKPPKIPKRKTRLDAEFVIELESERHAYARRCGMTDDQMEIECDKFENFHKAKGSLMADWDAAWRTWARNWQTFSQARRA